MVKACKYPAGGVKIGWQTVLRSKNVFGPYEYKVVMRQGDSPVNGPHQGAWIDTVTGEDWFIHFQDVYAAGRIAHLQPMCWKEDWPIIGVVKEGNDYGKPVLQYRKPDVGDAAETIGQTTVDEASDAFFNDRLGLQWQWNANTKKGWYEIKDENLLLTAVSTESGLPYGNVPNLLLQKWPAPEFTCVTKLHLKDLEEGDCAGVISMGMEYGLLEVKRDSTELTLNFVKGVQRFGKILEESTEETTIPVTKLEAAKTDVLYVKYEVKKTGTRDLSETEKGFPEETVTFFYSLDGETYEAAGQMLSVPGRWVGVKNGVFCVRRQEGNGGILAVENVEYSL